MDPRAVAKDYIRQLISEPPGLKALLLDDETIRIISLLYTQSELLSSEVVLIDKLSNPPNRPLTHITAIVFIRPTAENVHVLRTQLRHPNFPTYRLFFSNTLKRTHVEEIAYADAHERVTHVRELYADYYTLASTLLHFGVVPCLPIMTATGSTMHNPHVERTVDAVAAIVLSLKLSQPQVRYQFSSPLCHNIAQRLCVRFDQERSLFDFRPRQYHHSSHNSITASSSSNQQQAGPPLVIIIDRREDPVTPLLNQWTYEAMLHELIGIEYNRVSFQDVPSSSSIPAELRELVLDDVNDDFFKKNRYVNFGDLGANLQSLVDTFQAESKTSKRNIDTIEQMMKFVANYPELRQKSANVSKHVALAGELSRRVGAMHLLPVSELEQDIACREAESEHRRQIITLLRKQGVSASDKLRLVMLYTLRYESQIESNNGGAGGIGAGDGLVQMKNALKDAGVGTDGIQLVTAVKQYAGNSKRSGDLFSNKSFFAVATSTMRRGIIGGVENVYTQHEPLLSYTLENLFRGRLRNSDFPLVRQDDTSLLGNGLSNGLSNGADLTATIIPSREVVIVMAGGTTYEEAKCVSGVNGGPFAFVPPEGSITASAAQAAKQLHARVILTGTTVHNSTSFAVEIARNANSQQHQQHFVKPSR